MSEWSELRLCAAEAPDAGGVMVTAPFVTDSAGQRRKLIDIRAETPVLSQALTDEEFEAGLKSGAWRILPAFGARRGFVTVVVGPALLRAMTTAGIPDDLGLRPMEFGWMFAYAAADTVNHWVSRGGTRLIDWAAGALQSYLDSGLPHPSLCDGVAHHAISLTSERSPARRRAYILLGAIASQLDTSALAVLAEMAWDEFGLSERDFRREVETELYRLGPGTSERITDGGPLHSVVPAIFGEEQAERSIAPFLDLEEEYCAA